MFEKAFLFTVKGAVELGSAITLDAYPASSLAATVGARYNPLELESIIITSEFSFLAACSIIEAIILALKFAKSPLFTFTILSAPYAANSDAFSALIVKAIIWVPNCVAIFFP